MWDAHKIKQLAEKYREQINKTNPDASVSQITIFLRNFLAGGVAGSVAVTAIAPLERAKLFLQIQNYREKDIPKHKLYTGPIDVIRRVPQEQGFLSFWRGNFAAVLRSFPYYALNFSLKDKYKDFFARGIDKENHMLRRAVTIIYPLDYARTRLAADMGISKASREFHDIFHCFVDTIKKDGFYGLYRGFGFSFVGVFIYRAFYFGLYDTGKDMVMPGTKHHFLIEFANAEAAATLSGLISYPFDTVRRTMMMQSGKPKDKREYKSSFDCMKQLFQRKGVRGFYFGAWTNVLRGTGGAIMLVIYDEIHHFLWPKHISPYDRWSTMMPPPIPRDRDYSDNYYHSSDMAVGADTYDNRYQRAYDGSSCTRQYQLLRLFPDLDQYTTSPSRIVRTRIDHMCDF